MASSVRFKGTDVVYSQSGSGLVVVLLHGFLEERGMWHGVASALQGSNTVIAIDLPGHGDTGCMGPVHSMEDHAGAVAAVLTELDADSCVAVGHSMGGYIALALAALYPELIKGLVLFHSSALPDSPERKKERQRIIRIVEHDRGMFINTAIPSLFPERTVHRFETEIADIISKAEGFPKQGIIANVRGIMERTDRTDMLRNGSFRKLMVQGTEDPVISNDSFEQQVALDAGIRVEVLQGIGHMGHIETPRECERIIKDFCADVRTA